MGFERTEGVSLSEGLYIPRHGMANWVSAVVLEAGTTDWAAASIVVQPVRTV